MTDPIHTASIRMTDTILAALLALEVVFVIGFVIIGRL